MGREVVSKLHPQLGAIDVVVHVTRVDGPDDGERGGNSV
jgi:hypothetical protein